MWGIGRTHIPWVLSIIVSTVPLALNQEEEYTYDDDATNALSKGGTRLVGAARGEIEETPFLVGYNTETMGKDYVSCTGSLLSASWILSAAHCILNIVETDELDSCVQATKQGESFKTKRRKIVKCTYDVKKNVKVEMIKPTATAYFGLKDVNDEDDIGNGEQIRIDFFIRHTKSYLGGGSYGAFGGYDITLLHLEKPADPVYKTACLPSPTFSDNGRKGRLAGYGKYTREPCQTDEYGPSKYHYCAKKSPCNNDDPPPQKAICKTFFGSSASKSIGDVSDIILLGAAKKPTYCFLDKSPKEGSSGWCSVDLDATQMQATRATESWGFCGKDCFKDDEPSTGVLRKVDDIDILEEGLCNTYLESTLGSDVEVMPQILCIGRNEKIKMAAFKVEGNSFKEVDSSKIPNKSEMSPGSQTMVFSAGTCNGDSGGPVFVESEEQKGTFVVLGAVSGGRGRLGKCGGINNPTHYVRVKMFTKWIKYIMGPDGDQLCYAES